MDALAICGSECEFFREQTDFLGIFWPVGGGRESVVGSPLLSSSSFGAVAVFPPSPPLASCITAVALRIVKPVVV